MDTAVLRKTFGNNKRMPACYERVILEALSHYPELVDVRIHFVSRRRHPVPYGTTPGIASVFQSPSHRMYTITLLEEAEPPEEQVLFKHLTYDMQLGVIGHELVHVLQFMYCDRIQLLKTLMLYPVPSFQKRIERSADIGAIEHGFGKELHEHAVYIRSVPGYVEQRKAILENYLSPEEILEHIERVEQSSLI